MDEQALRTAGQGFLVGEDLYGVSVEQLRERADILKAELMRITKAIQKKQAELSDAEGFFKKT